MRKVILLFALVCMSLPSMAEDVIKTRKGETISAVVQEITDKSVRYNLPGDQVIRSIKIKEVDFIKYENGNIDTFKNVSNLDNEDALEKVVKKTHRKTRILVILASVEMGIGLVFGLFGIAK